jgi:hypothetical protein
MLAVVNHMAQLGAKSFARDPINIGARLLPVVREAKQLPHFVERKPEVTTAPDKTQPLKVAAGMGAVVPASAGRRRQETNSFVIADGLHLCAGLLREFADAECARHDRFVVSTKDR